MAENTTIKFGSFNILATRLEKYNTGCKEKYGLTDSIKRYNVVNKILAKSKLDMIFLQEVGYTYDSADSVELKNLYYANRSKSSPNLLMYISKEKFTEPKENTMLKSYGLSNFQLERVQSYTTTSKDKPGKEILLINMHLPIDYKGSKVNKDQPIRTGITDTIDKLSENKNYVIIAGDTNVNRNIPLLKNTISCVTGALTEGYTSFKYGFCDERGNIKKKKKMYEYVDHIYRSKNIELVKDGRGMGVFPKYTYNKEYELIAADKPFDQFGPPYCDKTKGVCELKSFEEQEKLEHLTWPSDHAMITATFKLKPTLEIAPELVLKPISKPVPEPIPEPGSKSIIPRYEWKIGPGGRPIKIKVEERPVIIRPATGGYNKNNYKRLYYKYKAKYFNLKTQINKL